jgi:uncharacterized repeat protein (TIGR01451 family)
MGTFTAAANLTPGQFAVPTNVSNFLVPSNVSPGNYFLGWVMHAQNPLYNDAPSQTWQNGGLPGTGERLSADGVTHLKSVVVTDQTATVANILVSAELVTSSGTGATFTVNGNDYTQPAPLYVAPGQTATVSAPSLEDVSGSKWAYNSWSDGGAQTHTVTGTADFKNLILYLFPRYLLTLSVSPAGAGTAAVVNPTADGYYDPSKAIQVQATANAGYKFTSFSGGFNGTANPATFVVDAAKTVTANFTTAGTPSLAIVCPPPGGLKQGNTGTFTIQVSNGSGAGGTTGTITVSETVPNGMTLQSMSGSGWNCSGNQCMRSDALPAGTSYPLITVTVSMDSNAPQQVTNSVTVSGGGSAVSTVRTSMAIGSGTPSPCDINGDGFTDVTDVQQMVNQALGISPPGSGLNADGVVNVVDVQKSINAVLGLGCTD